MILRRRHRAPLYTFDEVNDAINRFDKAAFQVGRLKGSNHLSDFDPVRVAARDEWGKAERSLRAMIEDMRLGRKRAS